MKKARLISKSNDVVASSSSSSDSDSDSEVKGVKRKGGAVIDFEALNRHGYRGGLSVLRVPPPKVEQEPNWSWSTGKDSGTDKETDESFEERQRTRAALTEGEKLMNVKTRSEREMERERDWEKEKEKKNLSFSQKEKRKRDLGQASRGKSYVEEEKRLLRESGVYSGFDS
ncbi:hypothetical protein IFM89_002218 [Coptis chinensis]|uniref:Uncharacterized protein n=1 Tax=Coptis chinensis TaxID=261450 RepID=A0A835IMX6_9MAGN|nr:hypothetical protein IFM89_002218 [Coptis chinensis]